MATQYAERKGKQTPDLQGPPAHRQNGTVRVPHPMRLRQANRSRAKRPGGSAEGAHRAVSLLPCCLSVPQQQSSTDHASDASAMVQCETAWSGGLQAVSMVPPGSIPSEHANGQAGGSLAVRRAGRGLGRHRFTDPWVVTHSLPCRNRVVLVKSPTGQTRQGH